MCKVFCSLGARLHRPLVRRRQGQKGAAPVFSFKKYFFNCLNTQSLEFGRTLVFLYEDLSLPFSQFLYGGARPTYRGPA